jgi:hypothetical protein
MKKLLCLLAPHCWLAKNTAHVGTKLLTLLGYKTTGIHSLLPQKVKQEFYT